MKATATPAVLPPATLTVTTTADSGGTCPGANCTLRDAIAAAASGATINFDTAGVFATAQTIALTTGELVIDIDLTINGPGASLLTISGGNNSRVFFINPGASGATIPPTTSPVVNLSNLTIALARGRAAMAVRRYA